MINALRAALMQHEDHIRNEFPTTTAAIRRPVHWVRGEFPPIAAGRIRLAAPRGLFLQRSLFLQERFNLPGFNRSFENHDAELGQQAIEFAGDRAHQTIDVPIGVHGADTAELIATS